MFCFFTFVINNSIYFIKKSAIRIHPFVYIEIDGWCYSKTKSPSILKYYINNNEFFCDYDPIRRSDIYSKFKKEIARVLKPNGNLLARVNSISDLNYGAGQGQRLEENYYFVDGYNKRFFSEKDAD